MRRRGGGQHQVVDLVQAGDLPVAAGTELFSGGGNDDAAAARPSRASAWLLPHPLPTRRCRRPPRRGRAGTSARRRCTWASASAPTAPPPLARRPPINCTEVPSSRLAAVAICGALVITVRPRAAGNCWAITRFVEPASSSTPGRVAAMRRRGRPARPCRRGRVSRAAGVPGRQHGAAVARWHRPCAASSRRSRRIESSETA